jgi:hypothetical protein
MTSPLPVPVFARLNMRGVLVQLLGQYDTSNCDHSTGTGNEIYNTSCLPWFCTDLQLGRVNVPPRPIPDIHLRSNWNPSWRLLPHALITVQRSTPYLKYHPVFPCHSHYQTRTFPTHPQGTLLLLPHHCRFSLPHIPTATTDSDVPPAGATIPDAMSLHRVPPIHPACVIGGPELQKTHCEDLSALLPERAALLFIIWHDVSLRLSVESFRDVRTVSLTILGYRTAIAAVQADHSTRATRRCTHGTQGRYRILNAISSRHRL